MLIYIRNLFRRDTDRGFTLTEVLMVVVLTGVLAAIAVPAALSQRQKASEATLQSDVTTVVGSIQQLLSGWRGTPPAPGYVELNTSGTDWGAFQYSGGTFASGTGVTGGTLNTVPAISGTVQAGNTIDGAIFPNGSYCVQSSNGTTTTSFLSTTNAIVQGECPNLLIPLAGAGNLPTPSALNLPADVAGLALTTPATNTVQATWNSVAGATSYTVLVPGLAPASVTPVAGATQSYNSGANVQPGSATITVRAVNANGAGTGVSATATVTGSVLQAATKFTGTVTGEAATLTGGLSAQTLTSLGGVTGTTGTFSGALSAPSLTVGGQPVVGGGGGDTAGAWTDIPLAAGWTVHNAAQYYKPQYRTMPDSNIQLRGLSTGTVSGTMGTLPVEVRPSRSVIMLAACGSTTKTCQITINTAGHVDVSILTGASASRVSLDGMEFALI